MNQQKYAGLAELLKHDEEALSFFKTLPMYVRDQIAPRGEHVNSLDSLRDYVDNITRGDG